MATTELIGQVIAGRYRIARVLGEGGQGQVFVAVQEALGREIALKVMHKELAADPSMVERFQREARTVSELQHPHIVTIYDFGVHDGAMFMAMELLRGQSLRQRLESGVPMSLATTVSIVRDTCSALAAAHKRDVVHRDLKPDNLMLVEGAGRPDFVKVLDFGIAKKVNASAQANVTMQGMVVGTPGYLAPEVATGAPVDARADLYALGVIWYEMVAGRAMFTAPTPMALVMKHAMEAPPALSALGVDVRPEVEQLIMHLLDKNPQARPESADAVVARLDALGYGTATAFNAVAPSTSATSAPQTGWHQKTQQFGTQPSPLAAAATVPTPVPTTPASSSSSSLSSSSSSSSPSALSASSLSAPPVVKSGGSGGKIVIAAVVLVGFVALAIWGGNWLLHLSRRADRPKPRAVPTQPQPQPSAPQRR